MEKDLKTERKSGSGSGSNSSSTHNKVSFYKLFSFADRFDVLLMVVGTLAAVVNGMMQPLMTVAFGNVINAFGSSTDSSQILHKVSRISLYLIYVAIASGIASFFQVGGWMVTGERQTARMRAAYLRTILRQDIAFFDSEMTTGEIIGRMSGDTILIQDAIGEKVGKFIQLVSTFLGGFIIALTKGWLLALVLLSCLPFLVAAGAFVSLIMTKMASRSHAAYADAGNIVDQTIGSIRTVAAFTGEEIAIENYERKLEVAYAAGAKQGLVSGIGAGSIMFIIFCTYAVAVWYGSRLIIHKGYNGGEVMNVLMATMIGGMALGQTSPSMSAFASGQTSAYKMLETIKRKPNIDAYKKNGLKLEEIEGEIELKDVFFRYPSRPDVNIFSGFSLKVDSGTTVALVGQSGSGKSTVISLLERFYDPDSGEVLIDGVNLKEFQLKWLRDQMGLVSQEPVLFTTSIRENICYAKENATQEEIRRAITLANAANFIDKMPQGLDTMVGQNGTQLSGGQKQRIAIARAILKDPRILLLDEATSALDTESERVVQDALTKIMSSRTTVVVAHRLTTIRNANLIAVVQSGKLVEQGTHEQLIQDSNGAYSQLVRLQEGTKEDLDETNNDMTGDLRTISQISSVKRSLSRGSSGTGSIRSFVVPNPLPFPIEIQLEAEEEEEEEEEEGKEHDHEKRRNVSIRRLAYLNKPELPILLVGTVSAVIKGLIFPIFGLLISSAIKIFYEPKEKLRKDSNFWTLMYLLMGVLSFIVLPVQQYLFGIAGGKLIQRIRSLTFKKVVHQEISWFDDPANSSGAVGARLATDAANVKSLVGDNLALLVQSIATVATGITIAFTANWILAFIILLVLPMVGLQGFLQMRSLKGYSKDAKVMYEEASQVASDAVGNIRTVASFCAEKKVMEMYEKKCEVPMKNGVRTGLISGCGYGFGYVLLYCANAFCFYIGAILVQHGKADFAQVFRVFFTLSMTASAISQSSALAQDANKARDSSASIFDILDAEQKIDSSKDEGTSLTTLKGDIELDHVSFRYPRRPDIQIFKDICLTIPSGKTVALVGESGSGKSSVISLIERFYDPISGRVLIDGIDITKMKLKWLRQQMALVSQEPILFNETIRENIAYSKKGEASEEEIVAAAKAANAHNFIAGLPEGYETNVGEKGVQLSGGQKQRIAIARAMLKDPKILLLDEATSALDAESERIVQDALDKVMVNRTTVVVAHRMSTIKGADMIAVVKNGVVAENGTHEKLMKITGGAYASLVALHSTVST